MDFRFEISVIFYIWVVSFISGYKKCLQRSWAKDHVNFHDVDATWLHCDCVVGMHLQCFAQIDIDIGTTFLYFQCFFTTDMFLFCKTILYSGNWLIFRDLAFGSIKTCFKAILKKLDFSAQIDFFMNFAPGGRLLHYKLRTLVALRGQKFMKKSESGPKSRSGPKNPVFLRPL